jgi:P27 family predicted phage terminase small subunit
MPDNVRRIRGTKPLRDAETGEKVRRLVLPPVAPKPPAGLSQKAAAEWRRVVPELERAGVLATIDRGVLTAYVTAWGHMQEAEEILKVEGLIRDTKDGAARHPAWIVYREANRTMIAAARELYLTPTSRLRIPVPRGAAADDGSGDDLFD